MWKERHRTVSCDDSSNVQSEEKTLSDVFDSGESPSKKEEEEEEKKEEESDTTTDWGEYWDEEDVY